jgi:hypothetical protein
MDSWGSFLAALIGPLAKRALAALGIGVVTYGGVTTAVDSAFASMTTAFSGLATEAFAILARAGVFESLSISSGGLVSGLAFIADGCTGRW